MENQQLKVRELREAAMNTQMGSLEALPHPTTETKERPAQTRIQEGGRGRAGQPDSLLGQGGVGRRSPGLKRSTAYMESRIWTGAEGG